MKKMAAAIALLLCLTASGMQGAAQEAGREVHVSTTEELLNALAEAQPGDEIILAEGVYENDKWTGKWAAFWSEAEGTAAQPITLRSENPEAPATLCGVTQENKVALHILGSYWIIQDLRVGEAQKGIVLDQSDHSVISGCEVFNTGMEGIHLRDNSSYCLIVDCNVHDNGSVKPGYGEAIYIGSAKSTTEYGHSCHYNTVRNCQLGPNTAAEHVDIKEYTIGTVVEGCTFDGAGMSGDNYADSFIDIKGNDVIVRNNIGYRNGNTLLTDAFQLNKNDDIWGQNAQIYGNTVYLDDAEGYIANGWSCAAAVGNNVRIPEGNTYHGNLLTEVLPGDVNADGERNAADAALMQDYLLKRQAEGISLVGADLIPDGTLDVFDLVRVKRELID